MPEDGWKAALADPLRALASLAEEAFECVREERQAARGERDRLARRRGGPTGDF